MSLTNKVDRAIALDKAIREQKKELDGIKAELQTAALTDMENKSLKYMQLFGTAGSCEAMYKEKFEIDNFDRLVAVVGNLVRDKVKREEEIKYKVDGRFKDALIALVKGDFRQHDLDMILVGMGLDAKKIKVAKKKLKGEYRKDKEVLASLGVIGTREEELDAIREAKNLELIERFFELENIDRDELKKCVFIEESLSIGLSYDAESNSDDTDAA